VSRRVISAALLACTAAFAQAPANSPFYGSWSASWEFEKQSYDAKMTLGAQGGTWQTSTRSRSNPCAGREVPIKVESITAEEAQLTLAFSDVIAGCRNVKVVLKAAPDGTVTGTRSGNALSLQRQ
jgi:hypothetical protein